MQVGISFLGFQLPPPTTGQPRAPNCPRDIHGYTLFPGMLET